MEGINLHFQDYYSLYRKDVYLTAYSILHSQAAAEDITEEAFLELYTNMLHVDNIRNVKAWLLIVSKRKAINYAKSRNWNFSQLEEECCGKSFENQIVDRIFIGNILNDLYTHNKFWYEVVEMHYLLGMTVREIALTLNCTEMSVLNGLRRARLYLKKEYEYIEVTMVIVVVWLYLYNIYYHI